MTLSLANSPSDVYLQLVGEQDATTVLPTVRLKPVAALKKQNTNIPGADTLLTEIVVTVSADNVAADGTLNSERYYCTGGTETTYNGESVVEYTTIVRGIFNTEATNPPTSANGGSRNYKTHTNGARCVLDGGFLARNLENTFDAGTTVNTVEAGEDLVAINSVSLHTDGKLYKYHSTNYPGLVGIVTAAVSSGAQATYTTFGGLSTGHTGLTIGTTYYAENTGAITTTISATTKYLGVAELATAIRVAPSTPSALEAASQAEAEAGTENTKYTTSLRVKQAATANTELVHITGAQSIDDVKTFTSSPIIPAPTTDLQAATKKYVDDYVRPKISFSTIFETAARFGTSGSGGTAAVFNTAGLTMSTGATGGQKQQSIFMNSANASYNFGDETTMFSAMATLAAFGTYDTESAFVGMSDADVNIRHGSGTDAVGFVFERVSGALNIYSYCATGAGNTNTLLSTFTNGTPYHLVAIRDGSTSVKYYVNGALKATHTTNLPTFDLTYAPFLNIYNSVDLSGGTLTMNIPYFTIETF